MSKICYLEGLRGIAAVQVMLMHCSAFLLQSSYCTPYLLCWQMKARETGLYFLVDGFAAVGLFFILSGYVLTLAFNQKPYPFLPILLRRWVRLQIPPAVSLILAALLLAAFPSAFHEAAQVNGSASWAKGVDLSEYGPLFVLREAFISTLFLGHASTSLFSALGLNIISDQSINIPLWSMHCEFWGSVVVIALVYLRARTKAYPLFLISLFLLFALHPIVLFVIGHVLALQRQKPLENHSLWPNIAGFSLVSLGVWVCTVREQFLPPDIAWDMLSAFWFRSQSPFHFFGYVGALLIFLGVFFSSFLQRVLSRRPLVYLGRISFGIFLLHFPILTTLSPGVQLALEQATASHTFSIIVSFLSLVVLTLISAHYFTKWVDAPTVRLSRFLQTSLQKNK